MQYRIDTCSACDCGGERPIVNVKYNLCHEKNQIRLGVKERRLEQLQVQRKFQFAKNKKKLEEKKQSGFFSGISNLFSKKKQKSVIRVSDEQKEINAKYKQVCIEIDGEREPMCTGCGRYQGGSIILSHSHLISREDCKRIGRPELIYAKKNITLHCIDFMGNIGCHRKWESKIKETMADLLDFEKNIEYIVSVSIDLFNKIMNR